MKRFLSLLLALAMVCSLLPVAAIAEEIQPRKLTQEYSVYYFETFEDLKELSTMTIDQQSWAIYRGEGDLVIAEDLTLSSNLELWCDSVTVRIPAGVCLQVGGMSCLNLIVEGDLVTGVTVDGSLELTGSLALASGIRVDAAQVTQDEIDRISIHSSVDSACITLNTKNVDELCQALAWAKGAEGTGMDYRVYYDEYGSEFSRSVEIPANCKVIVSEAIIPAGVTVSGAGSLNNSDFVHVYGTLEIAEAFVFDFGGGVLIQEPGGRIDIPYIEIDVYEPLEAEKLEMTRIPEILVNMDLSGYEVYDNNGVWELTRKGEQEPEDETLSGTCGENVTWKLEGGLLTVGGQGDMESWSSAVHQPWYDYRDAITSVLVEGGVTSVGSYAFYGLDNLTNVVIEEGVEVIGSHSMKYCKNLSHVTLPGSITKFGPSVFYGSELLTSAGPIGSGCTIEFAWTETIPTKAFDSNYSLTSVILPDTLKVIGDDAFLDCFNLTCVELPDGLVSIGHRAFEETGLTSLVIPASVTEIGSEAFQYCPYMEITFEGPAPRFDSLAFTGLEATVYFPAWETSWGEDVRKDYGGIINWVAYGEGDGEITYASGTCGENVTWVMDNGLLTISGTGAIDDYGPAVIGAPWLDYGGLFSIETAVIEEGVTRIGDFTFYCHRGLKTATIPASVVSIGDYIFDGAENLETVYFCGDAPAIDDSIFGWQSATVYYPAGNDTWTEEFRASCGDNLTWIPYECGEEEEIPGDMDGDGVLDDRDVAQLLWHTLFPETFGIAGDADFTGDGLVDDKDVAYLLWHTLFPNAFPL